jgi:rhodanese-related sulfurtransferase
MSELSPQEVAEKRDDERWQLVDVRESYEYEAGHIDGTRHIELARLTAEAESIDRDRPVIFYCRSGARSAMATQAFRASGWEAYNMSGGLLEWAAEGLPLAPEGGQVADH